MSQLISHDDHTEYNRQKDCSSPTQSHGHVNRIAPIPPDARWDPSALPTDETDDEPRWTELQIASHQGNLDRVTQILSRYDDDPAQKTAVVNEPPVGWYGQTALQAACMLEHVAVVRELLEAGADIAAPGGNNIYMNAFEVACGTGNIELVNLLFSAGASACINRAQPTRYQGRTPIQAAAEGGHKAVIQLLLGLDANINAPASPSGGLTALQAASREGHLDLVQFLISKGADVNAPACKNGGFTALQAACLSGETEIVDFLIENGAEVNASGSRLYGGTALHAAASGGHVDIVKKLLALGANPNSTAGSRRQTPVQSAYAIGRKDIVDVLVEAGAIGSLAGGRILFRTPRMKMWSRDEIERSAGLKL